MPPGSLSPYDEAQIGNVGSEHDYSAWLAVRRLANDFSVCCLRLQVRLVQTLVYMKLLMKLLSGISMNSYQRKQHLINRALPALARSVNSNYDVFDLT